MKNQFKAILLLVTVHLMFQGCVAYHTTSSLEQSSRKQIRTKVVRTDGKSETFRHVMHEDGRYYGMSRKSGEWVKTPLYPSDTANVFTENKGATITGTALLSAIALYGLGMLLFFSDVFH